MKVLVTGAAGFIGSNLVKKILDHGDEVTGIDNLSFGTMSNLEQVMNNPRFRFVLGDLANPHLLNDVKTDVVVHLASQKIPRYTSALRTLEENYLMLRNVIHKCLNDRSRLVFASTSDVYGKNPNIPFSEDSDLVLGSTTVKRWAYASSKLIGEQLIIANHDEFKMEYTIMRFFGSYGPNQNLTWWGGPQSIFVQNILEGKPIEIHGDGSQTRTFTYIDDLTQGIFKCIYEAKARNEIFNIAAEPEEEISIRDLGYKIWHMMKGTDKTPQLVFVPYKTFGKYEDVMRRVPDITKIKNMLGYVPRYSLDEGLRITLAWQTALYENRSKTALAGSFDSAEYE